MNISVANLSIKIKLDVDRKKIIKKTLFLNVSNEKKSFVKQ